MKSFFVVLSVVLSFGIAICNGESLARGWPEQVQWVSYEEGMKQMKETQRPIMLLIHRPWCSACKSLKKDIGDSPNEFVDLSKSFIMVNLQDEREAQKKEYQIDGGYIPRILFLDPKTELPQPAIKNPASPKYSYFFPTRDTVISAMKAATSVWPAPKTSQIKDPKPIEEPIQEPLKVETPKNPLETPKKEEL